MNLFAQASAASYTTSGATISSIRPSASASLASMNRPLNTRSLALLSPAARASRAALWHSAREDLRRAELRVVTGHPPIRGKRQRQPASERVAGDGRDGRLRDGGQCVDGLAADACGDVGLVGAQRAQFGHVVAGGENLVTAKQDDGVDVVAVIEVDCGRDDLTINLARQRVGGRPRQQQGGDA